MPDLITKLSGEIKAVKPLDKPMKWIIYLLSMLLIYGIILQIIFGFRVDLAVQFLRPLFLTEIILMLLLFITSTVAAVFTMYPDSYQKSRLLKFPYLVFFLLLVFFVTQFFVPKDEVMFLPEIISHKIECTICIFLLAIIPSSFMFAILQKGATTIPRQAGLFTTLAASSLGYLILRFNEMNDSITHLVTWHYLPMLFFALIGSAIGKWFLKW